MEQENNPDLGTDQLPGISTVQAPSVGQQLREGRERLGMSVEDVVAKIKLAPRQIVALESDDFQALPETAFLRGFVRSYAKLLQLDAQPLLDALPGAEVAKVVVEAPKVETPFPSEKTARRQNLNLLIAALLIAIGIAGFTVWQANTSPSVPVAAPAVTAESDEALVTTPLPLPEQVEILDGSGVPEAGVPESAVQAVKPVEAAAVKPVEAAAVKPVETAVVKPAVTTANAALRLVFDKEAWVEIKDKYGKSLSNHINQGGSELRVEGAAPFTLVVGHATSVHLFYRDKPVDMTPYVNAGSEVARLTLE
jgi:cytoskeleton protein RodZ